MRRYTFIDYASQVYLVIVGLLLLFFHNQTVPYWPYVCAGHLVAILAIHILVTWNNTRVTLRFWNFLRHFYPVILYVLLYEETGRLNQMFHQGYLDEIFIRLDQAIFGLQPSLLFMERLPHLLISEVFYLFYFSYYIMIFGTGLAIYLKCREHFFHYISLVSFVFYVCFLIYIFLPVVGPRIFFPEFSVHELRPSITDIQAPPYPENIKVGLFYQIMAVIYRYFETPGAAFPSSHVAVAICTLFFTFKYLRPIRHFHTVAVVLLCLSTVYCRYHYAVDVLAGALTAAILLPVGNWLFAKFPNNTQSPATKIDANG